MSQLEKNKELKDVIFYARKIVAVPSGEEDNEMIAATAVKNLSDYGFTIDQQGFEMLQTASKEDITTWYYEMADTLNKAVGGNHVYKPFYPNFPEEVMELSDLQRFVEQLAHYWVGYKPDGVNIKENIKSLEEHPLKILATIKDDEKEIISVAKKCFKNTLKSKQTPSNADLKNIINPYIRNIKNWTIDARVVENRNLLSYLYSQALMTRKNVEQMPELVTNDYMRIAKICSYLKESSHDCDEINFREIEKHKLSNISRPMRRFIAEGLESQHNLEEDVSRNKVQWKKLLQIIHIGEFKQFEKTNEVAYKLRNNQRLETYYGKIERAFATKDYNKILTLYGQRPGELIKNMNRILHLEVDKNNQYEMLHKLIKTCQTAFAKTRPEDLINFMEYIKSRTREDRLSIHNVKGVLVQSEQKYETIPKKTADLLIQLAKNGISEQIKTGVSYGKVYIDPNMKNMVLPKDIQDSSESLNSYTKGSRLPLEKNEDGTPKNIRTFIWWTNAADSRVDVDLSANLLKTNEEGQLKRVASIAYHGSYSGYGCVHSGDITDGGQHNGDGVCEYVDMDLKELKKENIDYVQIFINSYSGQSFKEFPCKIGWQEREELDKSEQFDIKAVKQYSDLSDDYKGITSIIVDVNNAEIIYTDAPDFRVRATSNSLDAVSAFDYILDRYGKRDRMTMDEIIHLAIDTNGGEIVENPKEADIIFTMDSYENKTENQRVITSKDQDVWLGEFMAPQNSEQDGTEIINDLHQKEAEKITSTLGNALENIDLSDIYSNDGSDSVYEEETVPPSLQNDEYEI